MDSQFTKSQLQIIHNAILEIPHALDEHDIDSRIGVSPEEVEELRKKLSDMIDLYPYVD